MDPIFYQNGKIYKLVNDVDDLLYVGSTCNALHKRFGEHKSCARRQIKGKGKIYQYMNNIGIDHFRIILVENYPCNSKNELNAREDYWINQLKPQLNSYRAFLTLEEKKEKKDKIKQCYDKDKNKNKNKEYYDKNKEKNRARAKEYREKNKAKAKEYREKNKAKVKEYKKNYRSKNKDAIIKRKQIYYQIKKMDLKIKEYKALIKPIKIETFDINKEIFNV